MVYLRESRDLSRGIFWITDIDNIDNNKLYFQIPCDRNGNVQSQPDVSLDLNAKSGTTYNHERTWLQLSSKYTQNKPFNYYPRGRVEIANDKATIYLSPHIATDEVKQWCIDKFNLTPIHGITKVRLVADGSAHYKCHLD